MTSTGYSGKPLAAKFGIKPGSVVLLDHAPAGFVIEGLPDGVTPLALPLGVVDVKVCAVDATWSGLKLVRRLANR